MNNDYINEKLALFFSFFSQIKEAIATIKMHYFIL